MKQRLTGSRLANTGARTIHQAYATYQTQFEAITHRAKGRFEEQDWQGLHDDAAVRLGVYREGDIFPQEFVHFLGPSEDFRLSFSRYHSDLFDVSFW